MFRRFEETAVKAYLIIRKNANLFINLFSMVREKGERLFSAFLSSLFLHGLTSFPTPPLPLFPLPPFLFFSMVREKREQLLIMSLTFFHFQH